MAGDDAMLTKMVQRELGRRHIDYTRADIRVSHGIIYLRGQITTLRGHDINIKEELEIIKRILRARPGVRGVLAEDVVIKQL